MKQPCEVCDHVRAGPVERRGVGGCNGGVGIDTASSASTGTGTRVAHAIASSIDASQRLLATRPGRDTTGTRHDQATTWVSKTSAVFRTQTRTQLSAKATQKPTPTPPSTPPPSPPLDPPSLAVVWRTVHVAVCRAYMHVSDCPTISCQQPSITNHNYRLHQPHRQTLVTTAHVRAGRAHPP